MKKLLTAVNNKVSENLDYGGIISQINDNLKNAHSALLVCDENIFPIIRKLLVILVTLPVTTATPEDSLII